MAFLGSLLQLVLLLLVPTTVLGLLILPLSGLLRRLDRSQSL